MGWDHFGLDLT